MRRDFWELVDYATAHQVGVKFSTNGSRITPEVARRLAASDYVDVQISLDGATADINDAVRGAGSYDTAVTALRRMAEAGFVGFKRSVVVTRHNVSQLDAFKALADRYGAQLRLTRLRPSGRGADVWDELTARWTSDLIGQAIWGSVSRAAIGFGSSIVIGTFIGLLLGQSRILRKAYGPLLSGMQSLPSVAWVPVMIVWFGISPSTIYAVVLLGAVPSIAIGLMDGVDRVDGASETVRTSSSAVEWEREKS